MLDEVKRLRDELVPEDELEDSKRYLTGSLPLQLETNDGVASLLVDLEWHGLGLDYLAALCGHHQRADASADAGGCAEVPRPGIVCAGRGGTKERLSIDDGRWKITGWQVEGHRSQVTDRGLQVEGCG